MGSKGDQTHQAASVSPVIEGAVNTSKSWASVLGRSKTPNLDNNVLEVVLEKDSRGSFNVSDEDCCNLMRKLGLDQRPGIHVVGVQICPNGRGVIFLRLGHQEIL